MSIFKVGQKVVFLMRRKCKDSRMILPKHEEIVTIKGKSQNFPDSYFLIEYPCDNIGRDQSFPEDLLRPLDYDFVEEVIKMAISQPEELLIETYKI